MKKIEVIDILADVLLAMKRGISEPRKNEIDDIVKNELTMKKLETDTFHHNDVHGSVEAYLEIYNDYENTLLFKVSDAEIAVSEYQKK